LISELLATRGLGAWQIDPVRLSCAFVDAVNYFKARDPERVERLWQRIQGYRALLAECHVKDEAVQARLRRPLRRERVRRSWEAVVGFPFFVYGAVVNGLPYLIPRCLARRLARKETDYATARFLASVVAFPLFWTIETWVIGQLSGVAGAALFALSLPLTGVVAYRYLVGASRLQSRLRFSVLAFTREQAARCLMAEREAISAELERAQEDYLAQTSADARSAVRSSRLTTSFSINSLASEVRTSRFAVRVLRTRSWAASKRFRISSSMRRAVSSLYSRCAIDGTLRKSACRGGSNVASPRASVIP